MRPRSTAVFLFLSQLGCGGAQLILQQPITDQCEGAGLHGCDDLTAGVLLYVDGRQQEGIGKIEQGVAANMEAPEKLKRFAEGIKALKQVPGAGQYVAQIEPILDILTRAADDAGKRKVAQNAEDSDDDDSGDAASHPSAASRARPSQKTSRPTAGVIVAVPGDTDQCNALGRTRAVMPSRETICVAVLTSIRELTDVQISPACPHDVIVLAGDPELPTWFLYAPASTGLSVHGANYPLLESQALVVALQRRDADRAWNEVGCAVAWSGVSRTRR